MSNAPAWVSSPAVQALLNKLVDRLDSAEARGSASAQTVALNATTWPALYNARFESDKEHLWEQFLKLVELGWLQVTPESARRSTAGYDKQPRVKVLGIEAVRKAVHRPERTKSAAERWREAIELHLDASSAAKAAAVGYCIELPDRSMAEVVRQLNGLKELASSNLLLREVSSRLFWGMSKILDNRAGLVAAVLELDECPFSESPIQLQVYLPGEGFDGVLFIENQMSFEQAIRSTSSAFGRLALVYASGFKGSAARLRAPETVSLYFSHQGQLGGAGQTEFESWLYNPASSMPVHFWGDLDWSGMRILSALKGPFPQMDAWRPGYSPMLASLEAGFGHSPEAADKRGQRAIQSAGCNYADSVLIPALNRRSQFVDQEMSAL